MFVLAEPIPKLPDYLTTLWCWYFTPFQKCLLCSGYHLVILIFSNLSHSGEARSIDRGVDV